MSWFDDLPTMRETRSNFLPSAVECELLARASRLLLRSEPDVPRSTWLVVKRSVKRTAEELDCGAMFLREAREEEEELECCDERVKRRVLFSRLKSEVECGLKESEVD